MAHIHYGWRGVSDPSSPIMIHNCKLCGYIKEEPFHIEVKPYQCENCLLIEKRDSKLNTLLNKKWWEIWK